jgi:hypothetical protein
MRICQVLYVCAALTQHVGGAIFSPSLLGISSGIVGADPAKEIDMRVHLAGRGCIECRRLGFAVKFVTKY